MSPESVGVDGPPTASMCQNEVVRSQARETVHGRCYSHWYGYVQECFSTAWSGWKRAACAAPEAASSAGFGFFGKLPVTQVGIEACGGSHYWARELAGLGH